jgi:hypothetical protein
MFSID